MKPWFTVDPITGELSDDGKFAIDKDAGYDGGYVYLLLPVNDS